MPLEKMSGFFGTEVVISNTPLNKKGKNNLICN